MDIRKKKAFEKPRMVLRREKLASIVQFATGGTNETSARKPSK